MNTDIIYLSVALLFRHSSSGMNYYARADDQCSIHLKAIISVSSFVMYVSASIFAAKIALKSGVTITLMHFFPIFL
jgi:hypothetical protein